MGAFAASSTDGIHVNYTGWWARVDKVNLLDWQLTSVGLKMEYGFPLLISARWSYLQEIQSNSEFTPGFTGAVISDWNCYLISELVPSPLICLTIYVAISGKIFKDISKRAQLNYPSHQLTRSLSRNSRILLIKVVQLDKIRTVSVDINLDHHDQVIGTTHRFRDCESIFLEDVPVLAWALKRTRKNIGSCCSS